MKIKHVIFIIPICLVIALVVAYHKSLRERQEESRKFADCILIIQKAQRAEVHSWEKPNTDVTKCEVSERRASEFGHKLGEWGASYIVPEMLENLESRHPYINRAPRVIVISPSGADSQHEISIHVFSTCYRIHEESVSPNKANDAFFFVNVPNSSGFSVVSEMLGFDILKSP